MPDYEPSDSDIVRARLRTIGVQEYRFVFEKGEILTLSSSLDFIQMLSLEFLPLGLEAGQEWLMYDVGGARSLVRHLIFPKIFISYNSSFTARRLATLLRRPQRHHLPRPHLLLRRKARRGPARQPPRGLPPPLESRLRQQAAKTHSVDAVLE